MRVAAISILAALAAASPPASLSAFAETGEGRSLAAAARTQVATAATAAVAARPAAPAPTIEPLSGPEKPLASSPKPPPKPAPIAQNVLDRRAAQSFAARRGQPIWTPARALLLAETLERAAEHALPARKYGGAALRGRLEGSTALSPADASALDLDLATAFLSYARDVSVGLVEPRSVDADIHLDVTRPAPADLLEAAAAAPDLGAYLEDLAPRAPEYARLKGVLSDYLRLSSQGGWGGPLPEFGILRPGDASPAVTLLRRRLAALGDLPPEVEAMSVGPQFGAPLPVSALVQASLYDQRLMQGVAAFQNRHGLQPDGVAGPRTLRALNAPIERRIAQIMLNMERLRWRNGRTAEPRRVDVNLAGFEMTLYEAGQPVLWSRVAVGQTEDGSMTPEFDDRIDHMVFHPSWNVPMSIARNEMLPKAQSNPKYFVESNMELTRGGEVVDSTKVDWSKITPRNFPFLVRQKPGPDNALGRVKFMFPNQFNIYLHDTPSRHLFGAEARAFSHGCVRVERPLELAQALLAPQAEDPQAEVARQLANNVEHLVRLRRPVQVRLTYHTAWVDSQGRLQFREDVYNRDEKLAAALQNAAIDAPLPVSAPVAPASAPLAPAAALRPTL
ncbi:L,D-transpeptidase family protein [Neomegalonema sp.]|uniref:L,D-transpeptidase family protein n=1 Tax=Neomegalonema sp. TaxID=2039713 RepID=UPI00261FC524|nr:L,D-transpeptidase family protein [Neomegalonema sp.]MDD2868982.1 L,D-transpeptidase family protein [Neomegalonema sp.]